MAQGVEGVDVPPSDGNDLPGWNLDRGARFIFLKERVEELDAVRAQYPGGEETFVYSGVDDRLLYVLYKVEK